jgi:hypothetical protein
MEKVEVRKCRGGVVQQNKEAANYLIRVNCLLGSVQENLHHRQKGHGGNTLTASETRI